jgi:hypothetical protein
MFLSTAQALLSRTLHATLLTKTSSNIPCFAGFIEGDCIPHSGLWTPANMPGWNADLTVGAYEIQHPKQLPTGVRLMCYLAK